jgi:hypothetical protein
MSISLKETQSLSEMAELLYSFLPGSPHPYAATSISFPGVANKLGLLKYWIGGSKKPAITQLLQATLEYHREKFCALVIEIVRTGIAYRSTKGNPITREEIVNLNKLITQVGFKIPELWDLKFLDSLPSTQKVEKQAQEYSNREVIERLKSDLIKLTSLKPQERGFAFEKFLNELFGAYKLDPRSSFRITGEQIDGSFQLGTEVYLVEAKWHDQPIDQGELLVFHGKVGGKSSWSRGLFVSYNGFTPDGLTAFSKGRSTNMIGMDCQDLFHILNGEMSLVDAINKKARRAAETGEFFVPVFTLSKGS